jgi:hypothetical protein
MDQTLRRIPQKNRISPSLLLALCFVLILGRAPLLWADVWEPLPWGLTLDQLNQEYQKKYPNGRIKEDLSRPDIELQYGPGKILKINRGEVSVLICSKDSSSSFRFLGYSYEGKYFGQMVFFKDHPELFPETINSLLRKKYPEGKVIQTFGTNRPISSFQVKSDKLFLFTAEKGVFFYDPALLEMVSKKFLDHQTKEREKFDKDMREKIIYVP